LTFSRDFVQFTGFKVDAASYLLFKRCFEPGRLGATQPADARMSRKVLEVILDSRFLTEERVVIHTRGDFNRIWSVVFCVSQCRSKKNLLIISKRRLEGSATNNIILQWIIGIIWGLPLIDY